MSAKQRSKDSKNLFLGRRLIDLIVVTGIVLITFGLTYWTPAWLTPLRIGLGFVSLLFAPGYVTLATVMPSIDTRDGLIPWNRVKNSLDRWEQIILSIIISIALVPILGIGVSFTSPGVQPITMVLAISGYTIVVAGIAAVRRLFFTRTATAFLLEDIESSISRLSARPTETDLILNLLIILLILIGGLVVITTPPDQGPPQFTEFYVLSGNESGDLTMGDYLRANGSDDSTLITMGITNHEQQSVEYTVIVQVQRAEVRERSVAVLDRRRINTISVRLEHGESVRIPYEFTSPETQTGCRIAFLLYRGSPPSSPTIENAYRELHLWDTADPPPNQTSCPAPSVINANTVSR